MTDYYYLISTLPQLDQEKPEKINFVEILDLIKRNLTEEDQWLYPYLFYPGDNHNFITYLMEKYHGKKGEKYIQPAIFTVEQIQNYDRQDLALPAYMKEFISEYQDRFQLLQEEVLKEALERLFWREVENLPNQFIGDYFLFDLFLRSLTTELNAAIFPFVESAPIHERPTGIRSSLSDQRTEEYPFIDSLKDILEKKDPARIQKEMDLIRWRYIDDYNSMNRFGSSQVFGYTLKLLMLSRWVDNFQRPLAENSLEKLSATLRQSYPLDQII